MNPSIGVRDPAAEALAIAASALKYENLSDLPEILRELGEATGSFAVLLWELAPGVDPADTSKPGQLFVLADWLKNGDRFASHTLPLDSRTGIAIRTKEPIIYTNVKKDIGVYLGPPDFFEKYNIQTFVSIPLELASMELAILNLYRTEGSSISDREIAVAEAFSRILPGIYEGLRERSSLKMMTALNNIIQRYEGHHQRLQRQIAREAFQEIAHEISRAFRCMEASIYLVLRDVFPIEAHLEATTFPSYIRKDVYAAGEKGLTGWVLQHRRPLRIFDLEFFDRDRPVIVQQYEGLEWSDQIGIRGIVQEALHTDQEAYLPPVSFVAVPILVGDELLGAIRCCAPLRAPYYFNERDVKLLNLVASQVGHYWKNWIHLGAIQDENRSWQTLVDSLGSLIRGVLSGTEPDEGAKLRQFLAVAHEMIPGAEILDIRLHDPERNELYFAATEGEAWDRNREQQKKRFPLDGKSAGAWVFNNNQVRPMSDVALDPFYNQTFLDIKSMVIAPISSGTEKYGVLDVRIANEEGILPNVPAIAELFGQQLGLYLHLSRTLRKVNAVERSLKQNVARLEQAEAERAKVLEVQTRVFEDLEHQLKGPVTLALNRISSLLTQGTPPAEFLRNAQGVRGLLGKARRVLRGMELFVTLAKDLPLKPRLERLHKAPLIKLLIEACADSIFLEGPTSRGLSAHVQEASFDVLDSIVVKCDFDLLNQAIYNVIDNACKYSFNCQRVTVSGGVNLAGRFYISVINKGIELRSEDLPNIAKRGWRGQEALLVSGQGSGIGCWFAEQVLLAHGGHLEAFATTPERLTEVRLQF